MLKQEDGPTPVDELPKATLIRPLPSLLLWSAVVEKSIRPSTTATKVDRGLQTDRTATLLPLLRATYIPLHRNNLTSINLIYIQRIIR